MSITLRCFGTRHGGSAHRRTVSAFAFSAPGRAYSGSYDGTVKCWDGGTLSELSCADECGCWINDLARISGEGTDQLLASCGLNGGITIWKEGQGEDRDSVTGLVYERGVLYSVGLDGAMVSWDISRGTRAAQDHPGTGAHAPTLADRTVFQTVCPQVLCVRELELGRAVLPQRSLYSAAASGPTVLAGGSDGSVHMWDTRQGRAGQLLAGRGCGTVRSLVLFDIDQTLLTAGEDAATQWDLRTRRAVKRFPVPGLWRLGKACAAIEAWTCGRDGAVRRLGVHSGVCTTVFQGETQLTAVAEEPGGVDRVWVGGRDGSIRCIDTRNKCSLPSALLQDDIDDSDDDDDVLRETIVRAVILNDEDEDDEEEEEDKRGKDNPKEATPSLSPSSSSRDSPRQNQGEGRDPNAELLKSFAAQTFTDGERGGRSDGKAGSAKRVRAEPAAVRTVEGDKTGITQMRVLNDGETVLTRDAAGAFALWRVGSLTCEAAADAPAEVSFADFAGRCNAGTPGERGLPQGLRVDTSTGVFQVVVAVGRGTSGPAFQSVEAAALREGARVGAFHTQSLGGSVSATTFYGDPAALLQEYQ